MKLETMVTTINKLSTSIHDIESKQKSNEDRTAALLKIIQAREGTSDPKKSYASKMYNSESLNKVSYDYVEYNDPKVDYKNSELLESLASNDFPKFNYETITESKSKALGNTYSSFGADGEKNRNFTVNSKKMNLIFFS